MPTQFFTDGSDSFTVTAAGAFFLTFLAGDDILDIRGGTFTTAAMGEGDDQIFLRSSDALVYGEGGSDRFDVYGGGFEGHGGTGNDLFFLRGGSDVSMFGDDGVDRFNVIAASANLLLHGGAGNDDFFGYGQAISGDVHGDAGSDYFVLFSNAAGGVVLHGGLGDDIYRHHAGASALFSEAVGEGFDSVQVARGVSYTLGQNLDNISVSGFSGSTAGTATLTGNALGNTIIAHNNVDIVFGGGGNDRLFGKGENDTLGGEDGDDYLDGGPGNDTINGGAGNDTLQGRAGDDAMAGGAGDDVYYLDSAGDVIAENPGEGTDLIRSSVSVTIPNNVENAILSGTDNIVVGGNTHDNNIVGNSGNNWLGGLGGDDVLNGGTGDDVLAGGAGRDTLVGGSGSDTFLFAASDPAPDLILDFETGIDVLDVSAIDANAMVDGDQAFAIQHMGVPTGTAGELWYNYTDDGAGGYRFTWYGDVDGDRIADLQFELHSDAAVPHDDWVF